jgi:ribosomal protein S18 acetylase RimI-like enzyme
VANSEILAIEGAAFDAWPAAEVRMLGPWRLRFMSGVTNRANSAWVGPGEPVGGIEGGVAAVEEFYAERQIPAMFQLNPLSHPHLDALLAARGYEVHGATSVQAADAPRVASIAPGHGIATSCEPELPERWFEVSGRRGRFKGDDTAVYRGLLERLSGRCGFACALDSSGAVASVGLAVLSARLAGIFSLLTLPIRRGRGFGEAVLRELARFSVERGARLLYLQVERDNVPALRLYARAGFAETHGYHYRRRSAPALFA